MVWFGLPAWLPPPRTRRDHLEWRVRPPTPLYATVESWTRPRVAPLPAPPPAGRPNKRGRAFQNLKTRQDQAVKPSPISRPVASPRLRPPNSCCRRRRCRLASVLTPAKARARHRPRRLGPEAEEAAGRRDATMPLPLAKARRGFSPQPARSSCRSQLEQDVSHRSPSSPSARPPARPCLLSSRPPRLQVKRLRKALQEETALHAVLEGALGRAAVTLADMAYLPTNVRRLRRGWFGLAWLPRRRSLTLDILSSLFFRRRSCSPTSASSRPPSPSWRRRWSLCISSSSRRGTRGGSSSTASGTCPQRRPLAPATPGNSDQMYEFPCSSTFLFLLNNCKIHLDCI